MKKYRSILSVVVFVLLVHGSLVLSAVEPGVDEISLFPSSMELQGKDARQRLVVTANVDGRLVDVTDLANLSVSPGTIAEVDSEGNLRPLSNGTAKVTARWERRKVTGQLVVHRADELPPVSFELHVQPVLVARGCSFGACHGKARGQNGFQLSLLSFDPEFDFSSLTRHSRGRRVFPASPDRSLLLLKPTGEVPHGGGIRLHEEDHDYSTLHRWISSGTPRRIDGEPTLQRISVFPQERIMRPEQTQRLVVTAFFSDDSSRDVTGQTTFQSNESAIVAVNTAGLAIAGPFPGESTLMARYMGQIATTHVLIPLEGDVPETLYADLPRNNFIDELAWEKLKLMRVTPSEGASDSRYLRRCYIDLIGRLPRPEEVRLFLSSSDPGKREKLVEELLERPEYADHWANKWADLLRPNPYRVGIKAVLNYDNWIRQSFRENKPYDQFVRELVTAEGSTWRNGAATLFRDRRSPDEIATIVSQLFLGIRLECAKCHHHPFERWSQEDFYSFAAYFSQVGRKGTGLSPPISGGEEIIMTAKSGSVSHPLTGETLPPRPLYGEVELVENETQRDTLARWITSRENTFFAKVLVNRIWADMMGRGLVEPVDDLRATNPATNEPLLEQLAEHFQQSDYDLKSLIGTIARSHLYSLRSEPTERNVADTQNYSRHYRQRLRAEVLVDAVSDITGVHEQHSGMVPDSRTNQIWTHRVSSLFLDTFGRPDPNQDPPCDRTGESTVTQALHLMNAPNIHSKITSEEGNATRWAKSDLTAEQIIDEIYLWCYARFPSEEERQVCTSVYQEKDMTRQRATEDILWAIFNTPEFIIKD
tara:strand:+ start:320 stop:2782 length:2463 start_codon:yes stop_codon:yes gene_type:complete